MIFHNYLKVTSPYQAGILDLKGPGGSLIGSPVITFDQQQSGSQAGDWKALLEAIKFTDKGNIEIRLSRNNNDELIIEISDTGIGIEPGVGLYAVQTAVSSDFEPIMAVTLLLGFCFMLANFFIDILYGLLDPRLRRNA